MVKIPKQLQIPGFRFALAIKNSKLPQEKQWNTENNYPFFSDKLINHQGNYIVCTGINHLVVLDFDDIKFYNSVADKLPPTFTVKSAGKGLPHLYYILIDKMFKKIAITDKNKNVQCDIQALRVGVIGPGSIIDRKYYSITNNRKIATITFKQLSEALGGLRRRYHKNYTGPNTANPNMVERTIKMLEELKIERMQNTLFKCPRHDMEGKGNLAVLPDGQLWCFHCQKHWHLEQFMKKVKKYGRNY